MASRRIFLQKSTQLAVGALAAGGVAVSNSMSSRCRIYPLCSAPHHAQVADVRRIPITVRTARDKRRSVEQELPSPGSSGNPEVVTRKITNSGIVTPRVF
jgi:uncharacterized protein YcfJ